jgi:hypothetical protein
MISIRPAATRAAIEILGMIGVEPLHERSAGVQADLERLVGLEHIEERLVAVLVSLLEDVVEVAGGLVIVTDENQADSIHHGGREFGA